MLRDRRGNLVSTSSRQALDLFDDAVEKLHGYFLDPIAVIDEAIRLDPNFVMAHAFKASALALATDQRLTADIARHRDAAREAAKGASGREQAHVGALDAWLDGDFQAATEIWGRIAAAHPRDSVALQNAHIGDFLLGQSALLRDRPASVLHAWSEDVPGFGFVLGMHAFGLEETGDYARAEATGRRALALNARDPWAVHAVTHVMEMQGRTGDGIAWLTGRERDWADDNMFAYHNWWHLALYHLDRGEHARVLELHDTRIRPKPSEAPLEMLDSTALLWRLWLRGVDVGNRWAAIAESWAPIAGDGHYAFNDWHAVMALVGAGRFDDAARAVAVMSRCGDGQGTNAMMTREVGLPLAQAALAFGRGDHATALDLLLRVRAIAQRFGGSHAQRDLIHLTACEAALRAGEGAIAQALASERLALKPDSPFNRAFATRAAATGRAAA